MDEYGKHPESAEMLSQGKIEKSRGLYKALIS